MEKIKRGESITIHFTAPGYSHGYALCSYSGKRDGKHHFVSETYGWKFIVDVAAGTVVCDHVPGKVYQIDNRTGWVQYLN